MPKHSQPRCVSRTSSCRGSLHRICGSRRNGIMENREKMASVSDLVSRFRSHRLERPAPGAPCSRPLKKPVRGTGRASTLELSRCPLPAVGLHRRIDRPKAGGMGVGCVGVRVGTGVSHRADRRFQVTIELIEVGGQLVNQRLHGVDVHGPGMVGRGKRDVSRSRGNPLPVKGLCVVAPGHPPIEALQFVAGFADQ